MPCTGYRARRRRVGADAAELATVELYGDHPVVAFVDPAAEVATELRLICALEAELAIHAAERETAYRWADPGQLARTLPGLGEVAPLPEKSLQDLRRDSRRLFVGVCVGGGT
jgi:hypothetical protein